MRTLALFLITPVTALSLACGLTDAPAPPPTPAPAADDEPADDGFGALFEPEDDAPRAPSGDTAEPPPVAATPAAAVPAPAAPPAVAVAPAAVAPAAGSPAGAPRVTAPAPTTDARDPEPAIGGYRAVVAFYSGQTPEEFSALVAALRSAGAGHNIQVVLAPVGADSVAVDGGSVNIGAFRAARDAGFVFKASGRQAVFAHYPAQTPVISAASDYFGVTL